MPPSSLPRILTLLSLAAALGLVAGVTPEAGAARARFRQAGVRPELALQTSHSTEVMAVALSPDERTAATGGDDGRVKFWDARGGRLKRTLNAHRGPACGVAFTPDGALLASAGWDMTVKLWDAHSGEARGSLPNPERVSFNALVASSDGRIAAAGMGGEAPASDPALPGRVLVWDAASRTLLQTFEEGGEITSLAFSPDGRRLAGGGADAKLKLWEVATGRLLASHAGHSDAITSVAYSPDGLRVASGSLDGTVKVREALTGALTRELAGEVGERNQVAFSPADGSLFVGNSSQRFFRVSDGALLSTMALAMLRTNAVAVSHDGRLVAGVGLGAVPDGTPNSDVPLFEQVHFWDARTGKFMQRLNGYTDGVTSVAVSQSGLLAAGGFDRVVRLWDARAGRVLRALHHPTTVWAVAFSPDSATLAVATGDMARPGEVVTRETVTGAVIKRLRGHTQPARAVSFSPDGRTLASGGDDGTVILWNPETGESIRKLTDGNRPVFALAFSPDGGRIAAGSFDHKVRLWDVQTGALVMTLTGNTQAVLAVAYSPDGARLATGSKDRRVKIWDAATGNLLTTLDTGSLHVTSLAYLEGGGKLAVGNGDGAVTVWNPGTGERLLTLRAHDLGVNALAAANPAGTRFFSGSADNTVRLWESGGAERATLYSLRPGETEGRTPGLPSGEGFFPPEGMRTAFVVMTPEGYYAASPQAQRLARFRVGDELFLAESFKGPYHRPGNVGLALAGSPTPPSPALSGPVPPLAGFTSPRDGDTFTGDALAVTLVVTDDSQVSRVTLFFNGAPVNARLVKLAPPTAVPAGLTLGSRDVPTSHRTSRAVTAKLSLPARLKALTLRALVTDDSGLQFWSEEVKVTRR